MPNFEAVDVETANSDQGSICAVAVVTVRDGVVADRWKTLVDPESEFLPRNVEIHGITPDQVADAPTFADIYKALLMRLESGIMVSHGAFDRSALRRATHRYRLPEVDVDFVNSQTVAKRTWPELSRAGFGLAPVCKALGIKPNHHEPLSDAEAASEIVIKAWKTTHTDFDAWIQDWFSW